MDKKPPRFTVTVNKEIATYLENASKYKNKSISGIINELINDAVELKEDMYWYKIAEEAEKRAEGKPTIPAEVLWKELGLNSSDIPE